MGPAQGTFLILAYVWGSDISTLINRTHSTQPVGETPAACAVDGALLKCSEKVQENPIKLSILPALSPDLGGV